MKADKIYKVYIALGAFLAVFLVVWFWREWRPVSISGNLSCIEREEERIVRGDSLSGIMESGETVKIFFGYYDCNPVQRGDIVAYFYTGSQEPLVKIVKALPGDTFELRRDGGIWRIVVNGEILKNSRGEPYAVDSGRYPRFQLYERDYGKGLPANAYMLLANTAEDAIDSRAFGLADKSDILGRAVAATN